MYIIFFIETITITLTFNNLIRFRADLNLQFHENRYE